MKAENLLLKLFRKCEISETNLDQTAPSPTSSTLPWRPSEKTKVDREAKKVCQINIL